jgi:hypothetical protein
MARAMVKIDETRKLPVWATVVQAFGFFWDNRGQFLRLAALPVLAIIIVNVANDYAFGIETFEFEQDLSATQTAASILVGYVNIIIYSPFCVAWSRLLLTREISQTESAGIRVGRRELRYMAWSAIVVTLLQLPLLSWFLADNWFGLSDLVESEALDDELGLLLALAVFAWTVTSLFAIFYLGARLMLVLPAISVSQRLSLAMSWRLTRRSGLRIAAVLFAAILPELVVWIMVAELGPVLDRPAVYITALVLFSIVDVASIAIVITVTCLCFCVFTGWPRRDLLQG